MGNRYRRVSVRVWGDGFFQGLSEGARLLWLYLLTSPQTSPCGIYTFSPDRAARDMKQTTEGLRERFRELLISAPETSLKWDRDHLVIWLPNFLIHNAPSNPNAITSWVPYVEGLPENCPLIPQWYQTTERLLKQYHHSIPQRFRYLFRERLAEPSTTRSRSRSGSRTGSGGGGKGRGSGGDQDLPPHPPPGASAPPPPPGVAQEKIKEGKLAGKVRYTGRGDLRYDWVDHKLVPQAVRDQYVVDMGKRYPEVDVEAIVRKVERWMRQNVARGRKRQGLANWIQRQFIEQDAEKARARTGGKGRGRARVDSRTAQVGGPSTGDWDGVQK